MIQSDKGTDVASDPENAEPLRHKMVSANGKIWSAHLVDGVAHVSLLGCVLI